MVFVTAGMGGGTGTGAAPVIAQVARELGILTVGIVTVPFNFEGRKRRQQAELGLEEMRNAVDTLLIINNEKLREISGNLTIGNAFAQADDVLTIAAKGIADVISVTGAINVDFNDVNTVMKDSGVAIMGSAASEGEDRALKSVQKALNSPLLNDNEIAGAKYVLLNITYGDQEVLMDEITEITDYIQDEAGSTADVIWGHGQDLSLGNKLSVTIIATGFNSQPITGFEPAEEKKKVILSDDNKKEIVTQLSSPTQHQENSIKTVEETVEEEPFMKTTDEVENDLRPIPEAPKAEIKEEPAPQNSFDWEVSAPKWESKEEQAEPEIVKYKLEEELPDQKLNTVEEAPRREMSPEEQQRLNQERMMRIQEYTLKLKKPNGISEFEKEPAYLRRNVQLDQTKHSSEEKVSRFGLNDDGNGTTLSGNNSFLHDNVD